MYFRRTAFPFALLAWSCCSAQNVDLVSGSVLVEPGTTLRFNGPITWTLGAATSVENNGVIDLGTEAVVEEPAGAPIHGTGEERVVLALQGPFSEQEPGGLGLTLSTSDLVNGADLIRRHTPIVLPEGDESIARWFVLDAPAPPGSAMLFALRHDATELNGLQPDGLALYRAADTNGPWTELISANDVPAQTTSATDLSPWAMITAFADDAVTGMPNDQTIEGFRVWPTVVTDVIHVAPVDGQMVHSLEIIDSVGRSIRTALVDHGPGFRSIDISDLRCGSFLLRVNGTQVVKFVKA